MESQFPDLVKNNAGGTIERITGKSIDAFFEIGNHLGYKLESLSDVYCGSYNVLRSTGSKTFIIVFSVIAVTILLLACTNYTNLTTSRSIKRAKEIGLRKVVGTARNQLHAQFLIESKLFSLVATIIAVIIYESLLLLLSYRLQIMQPKIGLNC